MSGLLRLCCLVLAVTVLLLSAGGCGSEVKKLTVHPVSGIVRFNGKPMKGGGAIIFFPKDGNGKEASGTIAEDGTFTLKTYEEGDGAAAGEYRVVIHQMTTKEPPISEDTGEAHGGPIETVAKKERIPRVYGSASESPLYTTVKEGPNDIPLEVKPYSRRVNNGA